MEFNNVSVPLRVRQASSPGGWGVTEILDAELGEPEPITDVRSSNDNEGCPVGAKGSESRSEPITKLEQLHADIAEYERFEAAVRAERRTKGKAAKKARRKNRGRA